MGNCRMISWRHRGETHAAGRTNPSIGESLRSYCRMHTWTRACAGGRCARVRARQRCSSAQCVQCQSSQRIDQPEADVMRLLLLVLIAQLAHAFVLRRRLLDDLTPKADQRQRHRWHYAHEAIVSSWTFCTSEARWLIVFENSTLR